MKNIRIKDIAIYHGSKIVDNAQYIDHFKKLGKDVKHFFEDVMGRKFRYLIDPEKENSLTMAIEASKIVLKKSKINGNEIDMIVFSGILSQYCSPFSSLVIHNEIEGKENCFCHDMNVNCAGMTYALDLISRYMQNNPNINKVLLVGSDYLTPQANPSNELCYGQYGDCSCAVILEKTEEQCGLLGTIVSVNSNSKNDVVFPKCGFSNIYNATADEIFAKWMAYDTSWIDGAVINMKKILSNNNLTVDDVSMFCLSQFSLGNILTIRKKLGIDADKSIYIGDKYGYTGTTSPFIVLYEAIKRGKVKHGDYIMFWTVSAGTLHIALLIQY